MIFDPNKYIEGALDNQGGGSKYPPIAQGEYQAVITNAEVMPTKKGGVRVAIKAEIVEGEFEGRWVWGNLNLVHKTSDVAEKIGKEQLAIICMALGKKSIDDFSLENSDWCQFILDKPITIFISETDGAQTYPSVSSFVYKEGANKSKDSAPEAAKDDMSDDIPF